MRKAVCTTTIYKPGKGIMTMIKIAKRDNWQLIIAGDKKTPHKEYQDIAMVEDCVTYLHPDDQEKISKELSDLIGWNCIQRRNFSMIVAYQAGAQIIAVWDDDNIPYPHWGQSLKVNKQIDVSIYKTDQPAWDPLSPIFPHLWHRGFPIQLLDDRKVGVPQLTKRRVLVQADFWDGAPDIDAVARITLNPQIQFNPSMIPIGSNAMAPFNSQNTFLSREIFPHYFLFPGIGRMDDIWASYYVQHKFPNSVAFCRASVFQERNPHDLTKDLEAELLGYKYNHEIVTDPAKILELLSPESRKAFEVYKELFS